MGAWSDNRAAQSPRILIADELAMIREPLAASLRGAGYTLETAGDGPTALAKARDFRPDLIVLDITLPMLDGLELLARLRREVRGGDVPVILLTAISNRDAVRRAAELGVKDYILKARFSLPDFLARVEKYIGSAKRPHTTVRGEIAAPAKTLVASGARQSTMPVKTIANTIAASSSASASGEDWPTLLTREQCLQKAEHALEGRTMSGVVADVIVLAGSPRGDLSDLAGLIGRDAMLSARVLQAANSAAFAGARKMVTTISDAVRHLGEENVRNTAMTLGVFEAMPESKDGHDFNPIRAWQHAFAVATICQHLAAIAGDETDCRLAYLVGLCHDLGMILFRTEFGSEYAAVMQAKAQSTRPLHQIERHMLGMTQADVSQVILKKLGLPNTICAPIGEFHAQANRADRPAALPLARLLRLASLYADGLAMAQSPATEISLITKAECRAAVGTDDPPAPDGPVLRGQILQ